MKNIINYILNLIFPPKCYICKTIGNDPVCPECFDKIEYLNRFENDVFFVAKYMGTVEKAIKQLKFNKKTRVGDVLSRIIAENAPDMNADCIFPVPLHTKRMKSRGFNQSEMIARRLSQKLNIPISTDVLLRTKETKPQFSLHKNERKENIKDAFQVSIKASISGKRILLFDDICTTGSTIQECVRILLSNGAKSVFTIVLAKAVI